MQHLDKVKLQSQKVTKKVLPGLILPFEILGACPLAEGRPTGLGPPPFMVQS